MSRYQDWQPTLIELCEILEVETKKIRNHSYYQWRKYADALKELRNPINWINGEIVGLPPNVGKQGMKAFLDIIKKGLSVDRVVSDLLSYYLKQLPPQQRQQQQPPPPRMRHDIDHHVGDDENFDRQIALSIAESHSTSKSRPRFDNISSSSHNSTSSCNQSSSHSKRNALGAAEDLYIDNSSKRSRTAANGPRAKGPVQKNSSNNNSTIIDLISDDEDDDKVTKTSGNLLYILHIIVHTITIYDIL